MEIEKFNEVANLHRKLEELLYTQRCLDGGKDIDVLQRKFPKKLEQLKAEALAEAKNFITAKIAEVESEIEKL